MASQNAAGDWFDDQGQPPEGSGPPPSAGAPNAPSTNVPSWQNRDWDQIAQWFMQYAHRQPTREEVSQWGEHPDANYMRAIQLAIARNVGTPAPATTTPTAPASTTVNFDEDAFWTTLEGMPANGDSVRKVVADHPEWGLKVLNDKGDKVQFADGRQFDVGYSFGDPSRAHWQRGQQIGGPGYAGGGGMLDPYPRPAPQPDWVPPPDFEAPDPSKVLDDPTFKFRMDEGLKAIERGASAKGTLLSMGTRKDEQQFGSDLASTEYSNIYGRALQGYNTKFGASKTAYDTNFGTHQQNFLNDYNVFTHNQDSPFNKLVTVAGIGANATAGLNAAGRDYSSAFGGYNSGSGNAYADYLNGAGNSQAAAMIASGNAYRDAFGNIINAATGAIIARNSGYQSNSRYNGGPASN